MEYKPFSEREEEIAKAIVEAAYIVHRNLGSGLLEKSYEVCFCHELSKSGFHPQRQVDLPITYDGIIFDEGLRLDVLVSDLVICELKAVDHVNPVWEARPTRSPRPSRSTRLGFLININVPVIKKGIKRFVV